MKRKISLLASVIFVLALVVALSSCGHECTFGTEWEKDATNHWHACSVEGEECAEVSDYAAHTFVEKSKTDATCTSDGSLKEACSVCGYEKTTVIPKLTHNWSAATCTEAKTCTLCNATDGEALGHDYNEAVTDPTCGADGYTTVTCNREGCDYSETKDTVPATGAHTGGTATCQVLAICDVCAQSYGELADHDYNRVVTDPTCGADGYTTVTCKTEGCTYEATEDVVPATGAHTGGTATCQVLAICDVCAQSYGELADHDYNRVVTDPTCGADGYTTVTCKTEGCTYNEKENEVPATGAHTGGTATCQVLAICEACGQEYGEKADHDYNREVTDPTCGAVGYTTVTCKTGGCTYEAKEAEVPATGEHTGGTATCQVLKVCDVCAQSYGDYADHDYNREVTDPTCGADGYTTVTCKTEGCTYNEKENEVPATGAHVGGTATCQALAICEACGQEYGEKAGHDYNREVTDPTCGADGYTTVTCKTEGCTYEAKEAEVPATGAHTGGTATCQVLAVCDVCAQSYGEKADHDYNRVDTAPTCCDKGYTTVTCKTEGCDYNDKIYGADATNAHNYNVKGETTDPTCSAEGYTVYGCSAGNCGTTINNDFVARTAHQLVEVNSYGVIECTVCKQQYINATTVVDGGNGALCLGCDKTPCECSVNVEWSGYTEPSAPMDITANTAITVDYVIENNEALEIGGGLIYLVGEETTEYTVTIGDTVIEVSGAEVVIDLYKYESVGSVTIKATTDATVVFYKTMA